ncbi:MAG: sigma-54-dependent Fis family transcriptional regulator [Deltaproteobacteria bacterium]|nr:sigma-54-dependent Fis family transcriptional regulator [Deltaproteobacteria bacterium]
MTNETFSTIVIIDDDESVLQSLKKILEQANYGVTTFNRAEAALTHLENNPTDVVLCDLMMPETDGLGFLRKSAEKKLSATTIVMSAYGTLDIALKAIKLGAYDYIAKPFNAEEILLTIKKAEERERLRLENEQLRSQVSKKYSFHSIVAASGAMHQVLETVKKIADYKTTVTIQGESGTGKELVARAIHFNSSRKAKPFVAINCGAIPENLIESELFGHKRGAFTDATRDKRGLFEEAQGGTLLLDEIGELPLHRQVKLLRVLQENEIRPVGDSRVIKTDVRIIAATLRDLEADVLEGRFRDDLFYRLNVITLRIPALRERKEDIPVLAEHFLEKHRERLGIPIHGISKEAMAMLMEYQWPGNIRELENCIERAIILTDGNTIVPTALPASVIKHEAEEAKDDLLGSNLSIKFHSRRIEEILIRRALEQTSGNRTRAAKLLEISHRTVLYKLKEYGLGNADEPGPVEEVTGEAPSLGD